MLSRFVLVVGLVLAGCAATPPGSSVYDADANVTRFESAAIPLGRSAQGNYASNTALVLRAEAECPGENCAPSDYVLSVSNTGTTEMAAQFNQISFSTAEGSISFEPGRVTGSLGATGTAVSPSAITFLSSGRGELVRLSVPADIFASFATARDLSVQLGSQEYRVPYDSRASLRRMLPGEGA